MGLADCAKCGMALEPAEVMSNGTERRDPAGPDTIISLIAFEVGMSLLTGWIYQHFQPPLEPNNLRY